MLNASPAKSSPQPKGNLMPTKLEDQLRALAEAQEQNIFRLDPDGNVVLRVNTTSSVNFPALLAEVQRLKRIEDAGKQVSLWAEAMQDAMKAVSASRGRGESAMFSAQDRAVEVQGKYAASLDTLDAALKEPSHEG